MVRTPEKSGSGPVTGSGSTGRDRDRDAFGLRTNPDDAKNRRPTICWVGCCTSARPRTPGRTHLRPHSARQGPSGPLPRSSTTRPDARPSNRVDQIDGALSRRAPRRGEGALRHPTLWQGRLRRRDLAVPHPTIAYWLNIRTSHRSMEMTPVVSPSRPAFKFTTSSVPMYVCQRGPSYF